MIASARLGDTHVCPLPGHGSTPIASGSADVSINFMGAARVGDTCECGAIITAGFPSIRINGRPMAHLGSPTSHGGTLITGSADVGGGFVVGGASTSTIIDFMALGAFRQDGSVDDEKMANLLADPQLEEKARAANALIAPAAAEVCDHPDRMEELASYIAGEINSNIRHPAVLRMKALNEYDAEVEARRHFELPLSQRLGIPPDFHHIELVKKAEAMVLWAERVGQNRAWDHKPIILAATGSAWHKQGYYDYFYDIWSNIHYGYVGRAAGFSESVLLDGAGLEQIVSDSVRKAEEMIRKPRHEWKRKGPIRTPDVKGLRAWDDAPDRISIGIGCLLYLRYPQGGIEANRIMDEVLAVPIDKWMKGIEIHACYEA